MSQVPGAQEGPPREGSADDADVRARVPSVEGMGTVSDPEPVVISGPEPLPGPEPPPSADDEAVSRPSIIEAVADLLQFIVDWLRQEAGSIMHDKIVIPGQKLGLTLASGCAAAMLLTFGMCFIATGIFILLGQWLTYPGALLLIGGVLVVGAIIFTVIKMRSFQK